MNKYIDHTYLKAFGTESDIIKLCNNNVGNKFLTPNKNIKFFKIITIIVLF